VRGEELLEAMPHRGRNVLIDSYEDDGEGGGRATLTIAPGDPAGRDLFLVSDESVLRYASVFLVEHVALNSVMILREEMGGGRLAYFSAVTKFESHGTAPAGTPLVSHVTRGRDRREFRSFKALVETESGSPVLTVHFMAYLAARGERPDTAATAAAPADFCRPSPELFPGIDPALVFVGEPDAEGRSGGVYPEDHPLCAGHFPGAPVMMGMSQWMAVAERAALAAPAGESEVFGDGAIARADGSPVLDVTGLRAAVRKDSGGRVRSLRLLETRKVAFRGMVFPGDAYVATFTKSGR
jgi:3-hydroxymyristoyl/3-hydroxydecanoyl-(acyl carrier protein) dehydratase